MKTTGSQNACPFEDLGIARLVSINELKIGRATIGVSLQPPVPEQRIVSRDDSARRGSRWQIADARTVSLDLTPLLH